MKNTWLWLGGLALCLVALTAGVGAQKNNSSSASADQMNGCEPQNGKTFTIRGVVTRVSPMPGNPNVLISSVMTGAGCEVVVNGSPWQLGLLSIVNSPVKFTASSNGGFLSNPQGVVKDSTAPAALPSYEPEPRASIRAYMTEGAEWISQSEGIITITRKNGNQETYGISKSLGGQIKLNAWNTFYYDDQYNVIAVEN